MLPATYGESSPPTAARVASSTSASPCSTCVWNTRIAPSSARPNASMSRSPSRAPISWTTPACLSASSHWPRSPAPGPRDAPRVPRRLLHLAPLERRPDQAELEPPPFAALRLVGQQTGGALQPPVRDRRVLPVRVLQCQPEPDASGIAPPALRGEGGERPPERLDALVGVRAPPCGFGQSFEVVAAQALLVQGEERLVRLLPGLRLERAPV